MGSINDRYLDDKNISLGVGLLPCSRLWVMKVSTLWSDDLEDLDFKGLRKLLAGEQVYFVWVGLKEDSEVLNVDGIGNLLWT